MKKRRERTREEKKRLAEVMFGKNYKNLSLSPKEQKNPDKKPG